MKAEITTKELVDTLYVEVSDLSVTDEVLEDISKQCAHVCINRILEALEYHTWQNRDIIEYYVEVKGEIDKV